MDTAAFFHFLQGTTPAGRILSVIHFATQSGNPTVKHFPNADIAASYAISADAQKEDVYARVTPLKHIPASGRGRKEDTAGTSVLWIDLDSKSGRTKQQNLDMLRTYPLPPTLIIDSGNGLHAYWKLERFLVRNLDMVEGRNRGLAHIFNADHCWDLSRVLRPPGTHNWKDASNPKPVTTLDYFPERIYQADQFAAAAESVDAKPQQQYEVESLPESFLSDAPQQLRDRITTPAADRSSNDHAIAVQMLRLGFNPGQVAFVLSHPDWPSGEKFRADGVRFDWAYLNSTVANAVGVVEKEQSTTISFLQQVLKDKNLTDTDKANRTLEALERDGHQIVCDGKQLFVIDKEGRFVDDVEAWLSVQTGTSTKAGAFQVLLGMITPILMQPDHPRRTETVLPWCAFHENKLRVCMENRVIITDRHGTSEVKNGNDRIIQLPWVFGSKPISLNPDVSAKAGLQVFHDAFSRYLAVDPKLKSFLTAYALALPLLRGMPFETFPVLHLTGDFGRGKSQTLKMITAFLYGVWQLQSITIAAANRIAQREILLPFDDYETLHDDQRKFILNAATGAAYTKASGTYGQGSEASSVHVPIALTSKKSLSGKNLRRRTLEIEIDHVKYPCDKLQETDWEYLVTQRSFIWSGYFKFVQEHILPEVYKLPARAGEVAKKLPDEMWVGLRGFLSLLELIAEKMELVLPGAWGTVKVEDWFEALFKVEMQDDESEDQVLDALHKLFNIYERSPRMNGAIILPGHLQTYWGLKIEHETNTLVGTASDWHQTMVHLVQFKEYNVRQLGIEFGRLANGEKGAKSSFTMARRKRGADNIWIVSRKHDDLQTAPHL